VAAYFEVLAAAGFALEVSLLCRLLQQRMVTRYRFLFTYLLFTVLAMDLTLYPVRRLLPGIYPFLYWELEMVCLLFRFFVVWEIYRHTFPRGSLLRHIPSQGWGALCFWIVLFSLSALCWSRAYASFHSVLLALECSIGFLQAVLVLAEMLVAKLYGFPMGRNIWGMAVGFGAYVSMNILNLALLDLAPWTLRYFSGIVPASFAVMLAIWTWALWTYAPNPSPAPAPAEGSAAEMAQWTEQWSRAHSAVRKTVNP